MIEDNTPKTTKNNFVLGGRTLMSPFWKIMSLINCNEFFRKFGIPTRSTKI
jgi:hypothetical protein